jgi:integrase/recombinase XerD
MLHQKAITISDAFDLFLLDAQARNLADKSLRAYRVTVGPFLRWCDEQGLVRLADMTSADLRKYLIYLQQRDISNRTRYNTAKAVKTFLNYCVTDELIQVSPFNRVQLPRLEKRILPALTIEEIKAVLKACRNLRDLAICYVLLDSGLRAGELIALNGDDIDLKTGVVTVKLGKGRKDRVTLIGLKTRKMVRRYYAERGVPGEDEPVFVSFRTGKQLTLEGIAQVMERLRETSGVANCKCHAFRRTFALTCLRNGMNVYVLAKLMGHSDISILQQYLALVQGDLVAAHRACGPADNML